MNLRPWVFERFAPCVMVIATSEAETMCREKNGLSVVNTLRPFGNLPHLSVPVRTVGEQAYRINQFKLRFYEAKTMHMPSIQVTEDHLKAVLTNRARLSSPEDNIDLVAALSKGDLPQQTPWFEEFKQEFFRMLAFSDLETFDHPVACLLVAHSHAEDPIKEFLDLLVEGNLPPLMAQGVMESKLLKHYVLLHDDSSQTSFATAEEKFTVMVEELGGASCHLMRLNSNTTAQGGKEDTGMIFRSHIRPAVPGGGAGEPAANPAAEQESSSLLSESNLKDIARFVEDFTLRAILPTMESRIRSLYHQVIAMRKGVRNQLKNFLWRSKSSLADQPRAASVTGPPFGADTVEGQMRALADLAFMFQDYETCLSTLRILSSDLKADKDWKHYAAAQEMLALAAYMSGAPPSIVTGHFREAFARYDAIAGQTVWGVRRFATRSQLLLAEYCCEHSLYSEANAALMRAQSQEENLIAAVLLEQAALNLLHMRLPNVRKWAFHLVLAALRFSNCQQPQLANRAYRQVTKVFEGRGWGHIEAHLEDMLGKHAADTGSFLAAASHFAKALACVNTHPSRQSQLLKYLLDSVARLSAEEAQELAMQLPLPKVDTANIEIIFDDGVTYATATARSSPEASWKVLEGPLLAGGASENALDSGGGKKAAKQRTVVVGETIGLYVDISNPLALPLEISQMKVDVEAASSGQIQVEEHAIVLKAGESVRVHLKFRALQAGNLTVGGVEWQLAGGASGYKPFRERKITGKEGSPLAFNVVPAMPQLQVELEGIESAVYQDELVLCKAQLCNKGPVPLKGLRLVIQQSDLHCCQSDSHLTAEPSSPADIQTSSEGDMQLADIGLLDNSGQRMYTWQPELTVLPGESLQWPFVLHPRESGQQSLRAVWRYQGTNASRSMPRRLLRWSQTVDVLPLLTVQPSILPCSDGLQGCLLHLQMCKAEGMELHPVEISEVACSSPGWRIAEVARQAASEPSESIMADIQMNTSRASAVYEIHPAATMATQGVAWLADGIVEHFHAERERLQHVLSSQGRMSRGDDPPVPNRQVTGRLTGRASRPLPKANEYPNDSIGFVITWRFKGTVGTTQHIGVTHMPRCTFPDDTLLRAQLVGEQQYKWDFARGPLHAKLQLQVCNCRKVDASICCETGTTLDLQATDAEGVEARRWHMKSLQTSRDGAAGLSDQRSSPGQSDAVTPPPGVGAAKNLADDVLTAGPFGSATYLWAGSTRQSIPQLKPGTSTQLPLQVLIFGPGLFQLTDYALFWTFTDGSMNAVHPGPPICVLAEQL